MALEVRIIGYRSEIDALESELRSFGLDPHKYASRTAGAQHRLRLYVRLSEVTAADALVALGRRLAKEEHAATERARTAPTKTKSTKTKTAKRKAPKHGK